MAGNWDFGGAFAQTSGDLQRQDITARREPYVLANLAAQNKLNQIKINQEQEEYDATKRVQTLMQQMSVTGLEKGSAGASKLAEVFARAGNPTAASQMMLRASQMQAAEASETAAKARAETAAAQRTIKMGERYSGLIAGVTSQADLDRANMIFMSEFGEETPPALRVYSPEMVRVLGQATMTAAQRQKAILEERDLRRKEEDSRKTRQLRDAQVAATNALKELRDRKGAVDGKAGGKAIGAPTTTQRMAADNILRMDGLLEGMDPAARRVAAYDLASYARSLTKQNPNLDYSQALQRAFAEEKARGAYVQPSGGFMGFGKTPGTFVPRGQVKAVTSAAEAKALPMGSRFTVNGQLYEATGGGKYRMLPGRGGAVGGVPAAGAPDEEDEE